eukprot:8173641-Pyramimonas_sp.AAC.2
METVQLGRRLSATMGFGNRPLGHRVGIIMGAVMGAGRVISPTPPHSSGPGCSARQRPPALLPPGTRAPPDDGCVAPPAPAESTAPAPSVPARTPAPLPARTCTFPPTRWQVVTLPVASVLSRSEGPWGPQGGVRTLAVVPRARSAPQTKQGDGVVRVLGRISCPRCVISSARSFGGATSLPPARARRECPLARRSGPVPSHPHSEGPR